ncbi:MAG: SRPBCC family protein [Cytophagales bacterium]|nr:SRPBCC family protein [Cytophagales bacterium]
MNQTIHAQKASNKHFWHSVTTSASGEAIWEIWTDVDQWKSWDSGLQDASIEGPFELNAKGMILSLEGRKSKFQVVAFEPGRSYTFKTNLPLGGLYVKRILAVETGKTTFTHEVWFKGLTGGLFAKSFGPKFREMLPKVMEKIKDLAEQP